MELNAEDVPNVQIVDSKNWQNEEERFNGPTFSPPVYQQRYNSVVRKINECGCKKVLDIGCAEAKFLTKVKLHCQMLEGIYGIDIDKETLKENRFRIKPLMVEYLLKRERPLKMALYHGSASKPDPTFSEFDFISCIELIEHLTEDALEAFPAAVFGVLSPKVLVLTTPNADFNVLFPGLVGFRHPDHKFEWTRKEFSNWCEMCAKQFGYSLAISFIGNGPEGTQHLGGCSQMAVFTKIAHHKKEASLLEQVVYGAFELVSENIYPHEPPLSVEERLSMEIKYLVNHFAYVEDDDVDVDPGSCFRSVPIRYLLESPSIKTICSNASISRNAICRLYEISEDQTFVMVPIEEESFNADSEELGDNEAYLGRGRNDKEGIVSSEQKLFDPESCQEEWWD